MESVHDLVTGRSKRFCFYLAMISVISSLRRNRMRVELHLSEASLPSHSYDIACNVDIQLHRSNCTLLTARIVRL